MILSKEEEKRYARQLSLPQIGREGQIRLKQGKVLIIGAGGLGSPVALYLAAAGIGNIGLMDPDKVDLSNLQRQVIHASEDIGKLKVQSAKEKMARLNPGVQVAAIAEMFNESNAGIVEEYDFIVDATDNLEAKFLINDACVRSDKPFSYGGIFRHQGQTMTHLPQSACLRCLFDTAPGVCAPPVGPIGMIAGIIGSIQAAEAMKYLLGAGELLANRLLVFDSLEMRCSTMEVTRAGECPECHSAYSMQ